jgi:RNA polymerase sigma factor (TIGR02999 family)
MQADRSSVIPGGQATDLTTVSGLLAAHRRGEEGALDRLVPLVYDELHRIAQRHLRGERPDHTLQPTALLHEAYLRLAAAEAPWQDRAHFFAVAAKIMRRILVDHARNRGRDRRGAGAERVSLEGLELASPERPSDLIALDEALEELAKHDVRKARVVELHYFTGLNQAETAEAMGISTATVERELRFAKAWLNARVAT